MHVLYALISKFGLTVVNAKTTERNLRHYDFELKERRMYYLDSRFVRARKKLHDEKTEETLLHNHNPSYPRT